MPPDDDRSILEIRRHIPWEENPSEQWAYALEHMDRGEWDNAIRHCRRAIAIWPTYFDAWLLLGGALEEQGDHDEALAAVQRASEIAILELSQAWNNLASLHLIRQEWEEALTVDRVLDTIDPSRHGIICYRMAVCYTQLGQRDTARQWLLEAIRCRPDLLDRALGESWLKPHHRALRRLKAAAGRSPTGISEGDAG